MPNMPPPYLDAPSTLEAIAEVEHERWSHWQRYLHDQCSVLDDGSLVIPAELVGKWEKQMITPYPDLSEGEKDSDREQAHHYIDRLKRESKRTQS